MSTNFVKKLKVAILAGALAAPALSTQAANPYQFTGTINRLPTSTSNTIIVSDQGLPLSVSLVVHPVSGTGTIPIQTLRTGQKIGYSLSTPVPGAAPQISEIWVLPQK